jgi:ATP-dependent exoDNAse (exonuclease V) alpha subunit
MLDQTNLPTYPKIPASNMYNVKIHESDEVLFQNYLSYFKKAGPDHTIAIARSNRMVHHINTKMRASIFDSENQLLQTGDVLLVTNNNLAVPLTNGDFVIVYDIGEVKTRTNLHFQQIKIRALLSNAEFDILISLDVLYGPEINFTREQQKTLMLDFNRRMKKKNVRSNTADYKKEMKQDVYLNCLRSKYGYAVTCHKAQGGEWDEVYLFLEKSMYAMPHEERCRWWYTAVTRARNQLHLANNWWIK